VLYSCWGKEEQDDGNARRNVGLWPYLRLACGLSFVSLCVLLLSLRISFAFYHGRGGRLFLSRGYLVVGSRR